MSCSRQVRSDFEETKMQRILDGALPSSHFYFLCRINLIGRWTGRFTGAALSCLMRFVGRSRASTLSFRSGIQVFQVASTLRRVLTARTRSATDCQTVTLVVTLTAACDLKFPLSVRRLAEQPCQMAFSDR